MVLFWASMCRTIQIELAPPVVHSATRKSISLFPKMDRKTFYTSDTRPRHTPHELLPNFLVQLRHLCILFAVDDADERAVADERANADEEANGQPKPNER